jgi:hypothetical protein
MVINTYYSYLRLHCTGCDNITSFFEMRAIQIVMGREWFLRGDQIGLFKLVTLNCILNRITGVTFGC